MSIGELLGKGIAKGGGIAKGVGKRIEKWGIDGAGAVAEAVSKTEKGAAMSAGATSRLVNGVEGAIEAGIVGAGGGAIIGGTSAALDGDEDTGIIGGAIKGGLVGGILGGAAGGTAGAILDNGALIRTGRDFAVSKFRAKDLENAADIASDALE